MPTATGEPSSTAVVWLVASFSCGIFLKDSTLYKSSIDYYLHANDNGSLPRYIGPSGQCQETGRDQNHVQLGLEALAQTCAMAFEQGDDLWSACDNRLMKGFEYTARYNLGNDVPFTTWTDCTGLYCDWTEPGSMGRGRLWDIYQLPYDHYVKVCGLQMPYTKRVLALQDKAERKGQSREVRAPGVKEGQRLHQVFTYPAPAGAPLKHDYDVFIQPRGSKEWTRIDTYMARVNAPNPEPLTPVSGGLGGKAGTNHRISEISYAFFDFTGDVFVRVVRKGNPFKEARVRPDYKGVIANVQNDTTVQFLLFQPENVRSHPSTGKRPSVRHGRKAVASSAMPPASTVRTPFAWPVTPLSIWKVAPTSTEPLPSTMPRTSASWAEGWLVRREAMKVATYRAARTSSSMALSSALVLLGAAGALPFTTSGASPTLAGAMV